MQPVSLRTAKGEAKYQRAKNKGTKDISTIKGERYDGMKLLYNDYPYNAVHEDSDMLLADSKSWFGKWVWWIKLGRHYFNYRGDEWHQIILNYRNSQSQPQIAHAHRAKFKASRKEFKL